MTPLATTTQLELLTAEEVEHLAVFRILQPYDRKAVDLIARSLRRRTAEENTANTGAVYPFIRRR